MSRCLRALFTLALLLPVASTSQALTFTINASDSGWHSSAGNHTSGNLNYEVGWENEELHNYFVFDLSSLPRPRRSSPRRCTPTTPQSASPT